MNINTNKYLIPGAAIIAVILIASAFVYVNYWPKGTLTAQQAGEKAMAFINKNIEQGITASLVGVTEKDSVYQISLNINGTQYESYITKDGKMLFPSGVNLEGTVQEESPQTTNTEQNTAVATESFAKCLTEKGVKFYGAWWCSHCQNQKKLFGDTFQYVDYIECEKEPDKSQGDMTDACKEAGITSFPTWQLPDGTKEPGEKTLEKLSELSGCSL